MSFSKSQRQIEVFRVLQRLKRARPQDIFTELASKAGAKPDNQAFQRAIHRDLKSLQESYLIGVDYFTASGEQIPPGEEDQHTNFRLEYYVLDQLSEGSESEKLYLKLGGDAIIPPGLSNTLHFEKDFSKIPKGVEVLSVEQMPGNFIHIWFQSLDRPITIFIGRKSDQTDGANYRKEVLESISQRSLVLLFLHNSISRFRPEANIGHCEIHFGKTMGEFQVKDQDSTVGTSIGDANFEHLLDYFVIDSDRTHTDSPFYSVQWESLKGTQSINGSKAIKVGEIALAIYSK